MFSKSFGQTSIVPSSEGITDFAKSNQGLPFVVRYRGKLGIRKARHSMHKTRIVVLLGVLSLAGCAVRRYQAAPIVPAETASMFESRNLADPALQAYEEKNLGHAVSPWPPRTWEFRTLALAALYFNPTLEAARARVAEAEAATITAGARPNPSLSFAPGIPSPYLFNLDLAVPIETAGKRGHRVQVARSLDQAARFDLADSAW